MMNKFRYFTAIISLLFLMSPGGIFAAGVGDIAIHGFISQGYLKSNDNNFVARTEDGTYEFNEAAINFSIEPIDDLRIGMQLMSRDMGESGNNELYLDWGYADYRYQDWLGFRLGLIKVPMGLYNQNRDIDFLRTSIFLPQAIYNENYRAFRTAYRGADVYGNIGIGSLGDLDYELLVGTPEMDKDEPLFRAMFQLYAEGIGGTGFENPSVYLDYGAAAAIRWNTGIEGLRLGVSNLWAKFMSDWTVTGSPLTLGADVPFEYEMDYDYFYVLSAEYIWNNFKFAAEYSRKKSNVDYEYIGITTASSTSTSEAYYGAVSYRVSDLLELGAYYSENYPDIDDRDGSEAASNNLEPQKNWTVSARLDILDNMNIKFETHFIDGLTDVLNINHPDGFGDDKYNVYAVKCSVNF